ncbi:gamma carbonic anhydrase family protein [Ruminococcaceae bacterium OttesenSCG-928-A11]|nr:gamma carbonic anhydrase family protein [Ruminococcaceae bacterium OttesenSCG-928-A11]
MSAVVMEGAVLVGDVHLEDDASVWYNAVLRADLGAIRVGKNSNIQDGCTLHVDGGATLSIGADVTVGHGCILHGCTLEDGAFVGMGSVVMDGAVMEADSMLGAGSLVTGGTVIPGGMLAMGRPAKVKRPLTPEEIAHNRRHAADYARLAQSPVQRPLPKP